jgi:tRNA-splicing ligase RtcB
MTMPKLGRISEAAWELAPTGPMRVPARFYGTEPLMADLDAAAVAQAARVAALPGIVRAAYAMPDAHWGYGFPIGGVAAFDPDQGGVVSAGGVGFDISCGVRAILADLDASDVARRKTELADALFRGIPAGVGSTGRLRLDRKELDAMLTGGAVWAVGRGYGDRADLDRIELGGRADGADPDEVSDTAKSRQRDEMGTLGSGNHYLEIQEVTDVFDSAAADALGLRPGGVVVAIHCGSRGLGHQVATDFAARMLRAAPRHGLVLPERELACAPLDSADGRAYLGAMRAAANCALANRQILGHLARAIVRDLFGGGLAMPLLYDVSHNFCAEETHEVTGKPRRLFVHRKGATRALTPGHPDLPDDLKPLGQPVLIGGSMGTASYILLGLAGNSAASFASACHGAGRRLSRQQAAKQWKGRDVAGRLEHHGILVRAGSMRGLAEEAPAAYKDVHAVVQATEQAGLARRVAALRPLICLKG